MSKYTVIVGNIGKVFDGTSKKDAMHTFNDYKMLSKIKSSRGAGEDVTLFEDGEPIMEHSVSGKKKEKAKPAKESKPSLNRNSGSSSSKQAYCMKCKSSVTIKLPKSETLSNGVHAVRGACPDCGTKVFRLLGK